VKTQHNYSNAIYVSGHHQPCGTSYKPQKGWKAGKQEKQNKK